MMSFEDLVKILLLKKPSDEIILNEKEIFTLIPELALCKDFNQFNDWHIYDVYGHTLHVVDGVSQNYILRLSGLFHDLGKPKTFKLDNEGIGHFRGHWEISQKIFDEFAKKYDIKDSDIISKLILYHDRNLGKLNESELNGILSKFTREEIELLYELKKSDLLAQNPKYHYLLGDYELQKQKILQKYR